MRKVFIFSAAIVTLASFSFFKTVQPPLRKVGKALYSSESNFSLKPAEVEKLKAELTKQYGIKNFNTTTTVHYNTVIGSKGQKGVSIAEAKVSSSVFSQSMLANGDEEVKQACIYANCSGTSTTSELVQILSTYSSN